jgi:two-component system CheB/CheR fusion protein
MYTAKEAGKNTYRYFTEEMDADTKEKMELTNDLRQATANNELILYYQPIIDIENNKLVSFEALVRWEHPKYGLVTPDFFIYLAEEGGFMAKVGRWILESVCKKIKVYQDRGYDVKIAVNISSKQLTQNHLKDTVKEIVTNTGIRADLLELEVTEGFLMENIKKVEEVLTNLRDFGIGISIDDFGTGYSSLSRLKSLPITKLKIDKSFIDDVVDSTSDQHIVSVIVSLAKGLNLEIVAEGVETREQLEVIKKEGCHLVQGYYFSKPLSESRVDQLLEDIM